MLVSQKKSQRVKPTRSTQQIDKTLGYYCMIVLNFEVIEVESKLGDYKQLGGPN